MIELICPSKGRWDRLRRMWQSALRTASNPEQLYLRVGVLDTEKTNYASALYNDDQHTMYGVRDWSTCFSWNLMAEEAMEDSKGKLFMLASDDTVFTTPHWDKALIDHYNALDSKIHVYHLQDSRDKNGTPHPIVTREYIEAMGCFLPPAFLHWYVDSWTVGLAKANNCFTHLQDYMLLHDKPSDKGDPDETHTDIRDRGWKVRDDWTWRKLQLEQYGFECQKLRKAIDATRVGSIDSIMRGISAR